MNDKEQAKRLIACYQQNIYALIFYLIGCDQDAAYYICARSFVEALSRISRPADEDGFFNRLVRIAIKESRAAKTLPVPNELEFLDIPLAEKGPIRVVLKAFQKLDFDEKALILLRDQANRSYQDIGASAGLSESIAKQKTIQARIHFREKLEEALHDR